MEKWLEQAVNINNKDNISPWGIPINVFSSFLKNLCIKKKISNCDNNASIYFVEVVIRYPVFIEHTV